MPVISCKNEKVQGIYIGITLRENQSYVENKILSDLIEQTLHANKKSLRKLIYFDCGGAAGCYDLGYIITQIINKIGEPKFIEMISELNSHELNELAGFIAVGLEYGDNDYDGKIDNETLIKRFPLISKYFEELNKKAGL